MSGRFAVGAIFGALAALSPPFTLASLAIGGWVLVFHGIPDGGDTATDGVVWASVWATVLFGILLVVIVAALGLWFRTYLTLVILGTLLLAGGLQRWIDWRRATGSAEVERGEE
jgi:hypothetical protein